MLRFSFIVYCILLVQCVYAQKPVYADSIRQVLKENLPDTTRVKLLLELAGEIYLSQPEQAAVLCEQAKTIAEKSNFPKGISNALGFLAYLSEQKGEINRALDYYAKAADFFEKNGDKKDLATCLNNIAAIYKDQGQVDDALNYYFRSLALKNEIGDKKQIPVTLNNIGLIYFSQGKIPLALETYSEALRIAEEIHDKEDLPTLFENIASVYQDQQQYGEAYNYYQKCLAAHTQNADEYSAASTLNSIGNLYEKQQKTDSALIFYEKSLEIRQRIADQQGIAYVLKNIGWIYQETDRWEEAQRCYTQSLALFDRLGIKQGQAIAYNRLGGLLLARGKAAAAQPYLEKALHLSKQLGYPEIIQDAAKNLSQLHRGKGEWKQALEMNDLYALMRDSINNGLNRREALRTQFRIEYERKEASLRADLLKQEAYAKAKDEQQQFIIWVAITGFLTLFFFMAVLFFQRNRIAREMRRSENLLLNILPAEVAEELKTSGESKARYYQQVTVMFTDFTNFTRITETLLAEELVEEINFCYSRFDQIIAGYNIEKIKTIGDSYMAAAGLPVTNNTHAIDMVHAALEIQQFIAQHFQNSPLGQFGGAIRIGIHTGPVVAGIVGIKKFAYDIWGDTVNIAARMESSGEGGKVNISGATYELVKNQFLCTHRGKILAKNKGEVDMYFVENELETDLGQTQTCSGEVPPLIF